MLQIWHALLLSQRILEYLQKKNNLQTRERVYVSQKGIQYPV